jgi:hypothetical protein
MAEAFILHTHTTGTIPPTAQTTDATGATPSPPHKRQNDGQPVLAEEGVGIHTTHTTEHNRTATHAQQMQQKKLVLAEKGEGVNSQHTQ